MNPNMESYKIIVEIFKGYLDTALMGNIWLYALTGAILTHYLTHRKESPKLKFSLVLPILLGGLIIFLSCSGNKTELTKWKRSSSGMPQVI